MATREVEEAREGRTTRVATRAGMLGVSPGYFATLGIPLRDGRAFTSGDRNGGEPVAIVSDTLARRLWPAGRAVGQRLRVIDDEAGAEGSGRAGGGEAGEWRWSSYLVVGVANDVRQTHTDDDLADIYVPLLQHAGRFAFVYLRTPGTSGTLGTSGTRGASGAAARWERDLRAACAAVDAEVSIGRPRLLQSAVDQERARPRFLASLLAAVSTFAAVIALVGLYGVIAYAARQREREIAVRMALGAGRAAVTRQFLREGGIVLALGLMAGLCAAPAIGRILESQLYGVHPFEPRVLAVTTIAFAACGLLAMWRPARRAATIDPALALKADP
jgi:hypothetical protein